MRFLVATFVLFSTTARAESAERVPLDLAGQRVAVLEVTGDVPVAQLKKLADEIRAGAFDALSPRGALVVTREATLAILREMGADCGEGECEIDTLRALSAHLGIVADITLADARAVLSVKVLDVGSGALRAIFDVVAPSMDALVTRTRSSVSAALAHLAFPALVDAEPTAAPRRSRPRRQSNRLRVQKVPVVVVERTPSGRALADACDGFLNGESSGCRQSHLRAVPHVERRASTHEGATIAARIVFGEFDEECFEVVQLDLRTDAAARVDLTRARLFADLFEYPLTSTSSRAKALWTVPGVPTHLELAGPWQQRGECLRHDLTSGPIKVALPLEFDDREELVVVEWVETFRPVGELHALRAVGGPDRPPEWPDTPAYLPAPPTFIIGSATAFGLLVVTGIVATGAITLALSIVGVDTGVHGGLALMALYAIPMSIPLLATAFVLSLFEHTRWRNHAQDRADHARLARYEARLEELAQKEGEE